MRLGLLAARRGEADVQGWPAVFRMDYNVDAALAIPHPADHAVVLGTAKSSDADLNAIVSLCRMGRREIPAPGVDPEDHVQFWLIDSDEKDNPNLAFVIDDAARTVCALRREGRRVLLHCVWCESRPTRGHPMSSKTSCRLTRESTHSLICTQCSGGISGCTAAGRASFREEWS